MSSTQQANTARSLEYIYKKFANKSIYTKPELRNLEMNYKIIEEAAHRLRKCGEVVLPNYTSEVQHLTDLIADLRTVLSLVWREISSKKKWEIPNDLSIPIAGPEKTLPASFHQNKYDCLCPLTVLLQTVARCITEHRIQAREKPITPAINGQNLGSLDGLYSVISWVDNKIRPEVKEKEREAGKDVKNSGSVGFANCIMFHEKNSTFTVLSSAASYRHLTGLRSYAKATRERFTNELRNEMPPEVQTRIDEAARISDELFHADGIIPSGETIAELPDFQKLLISGTNITVNPNGDYKPACLTDHLRFAIDRPADAQHKEDIYMLSRRQPMPAKACAEWAMKSYLCVNHDPAAPPAKPKPGPRSPVKASSYERIKPTDEGEKPQGASKRVDPLPPLGTAQAGRGRVDSPPEEVLRTQTTKREQSQGPKHTQVEGASRGRSKDPRHTQRGPSRDRSNDPKSTKKVPKLSATKPAAIRPSVPIPNNRKSSDTTKN